MPCALCYLALTALAVEQGLPGETVSWFFPMSHFGQKFKLAVIVCLIDVLESISIAKALAYKHKYELMCAPR